MRILMPIVLVIMIIFCVYFLVINKKSVPQWAGYFSPDEYKEFENLVLKYFEKRGQKADIKNDGRMIVNGDKDNVYGLMNLAELCKRNQQPEWPQIIAEHFDRIIKNSDFERDFDAKVANFEDAKANIATTIYSEEYLDQLGKQKVVSRIDFAGTATVLVYDHPSSVMTLRPDIVKKWNKTNEELFKLGLENVAAKNAIEKSDIEISKEIKLKLFAGDSFFVSANALMLGNHPECIGKEGSLVGIPTRHLMLCYPINDLGVLEAGNFLILIVNKEYSQGPGSISNKIFWFKNDRFIELPSSVEGKKINFMPPDEFIQMMNKLEK